MSARYTEAAVQVSHL